jgi:uncharacterized protein YhfF
VSVAAITEWLARLVLKGRKTATCWAAGEPTSLVMLDGSGNPRVVLETVELAQAGFKLGG